jgi:predicted RNA-binding Zn ribbon-like protein
MRGREPKPSFSDVGGNPAIDFVNTRPMLDGELQERLADYSALVRWAEEFGILDPSEGARLRSESNDIEAGSGLAEARALRETLRSDLPGLAAGKPVSRELATLVNRALAKRPGTMSLRNEDGHSGLEFSGPVKTPSHLVAMVAYRMADLLSGGQLSRIKRCEGTKCVLWFVDTTRNGSRHWCRMDRCGARAKAAAYYARRKS